MTTIKQVCVIGAGVMGSGIAAQVANSGTKVLLLDVASKELDRSSIAREAVAKMHASKPPPLSHPKRAELIEAGNLEDDLDQIKNCQLVIEVIVEKLEVKHDLYAKILPFLAPGAILTSNTSTLLLSRLKEKLPEDVARRFMITHFFNPPRYMRLLELITDETTDPIAIESATHFITHRLGKSIVRSNDTPGFIANRIGCFLLELVLRKTIEHKLEVEKVDSLMAEKLSLPSTSIFGLYDLIGLDVMTLIGQSLISALPEKDRFVQIYTDVPLVQNMIKNGYTGRKGKGGFYRMREVDGKKVKEVIDLETGEYKTLPSNDLATKDSTEGVIGEILKEFESYVRSLVPTVTDSHEDIDRAMKLGYSWKYGPFELFDKRPPKARASHTPGSGNHCIFDINTKMNCLSEDAFGRLIEAVGKAEALGKPLYIYSEAPNFSAGADLKFILQKIQDKDWDGIEGYLKLGQKAMMRAKYASVPVISCAKGVALGGGCELLLHSHFVVANQELSAGLVEVSLGLIPAFGGTKEMILRSKGDLMLAQKLLGNILKQNKSTSADHFSEDYMMPLYVNMNRDYLLEEAIEQVQNLLVQRNITTPDTSTFNVEGLNEHTKIIAEKLSFLISKSMTEEELLECERQIFMELVRHSIVEDKIKKIIG